MKTTLPATTDGGESLQYQVGKESSVFSLDPSPSKLDLVYDLLWTLINYIHTVEGEGGRRQNIYISHVVVGRSQEKQAFSKNIFNKGYNPSVASFQIKVPMIIDYCLVLFLETYLVDFMLYKYESILYTLSSL